MKRIQSFAILAIFAACICCVRAADPGPVIFKISATTQGNGTSVSKTNSTSTATNIVVTTTYTSSNSTIDNTALMKMLGNSFNMTFPSGAQLEYSARSNAIVVVNGATIVLNASSVMSFSNSNDMVNAGTVATSVTLNSAGESFKTTEKFTQLVSAGLAYDDSAKVTANGNTTRFTMLGVESFKTGTIVTSNVNFTDAFSFAGAGQASISNSVTNMVFILRGGFSSAVSGTAPLIE